MLPQSDLHAALAGVFFELGETLKHQGSLTPTAYVLPDWTGNQMTILSLAANSEKNRALSIERVQATAVEKNAVAVVWAQDAWQTGAAGRQAVIQAELQCPDGSWYRLEAPIEENDEGDAAIELAAALASLRPAEAQRPLFALAFPG